MKSQKRNQTLWFTEDLSVNASDKLEAESPVHAGSSQPLYAFNPKQLKVSKVMLVGCLLMGYFLNNLCLQTRLWHQRIQNLISHSTPYHPS
ncbi:hypothetical protein DSO57_1037807 [Entomophthora muscae]|uniref:Uncharacterized protein n=1 Tax=Entomophthora muscae TaxID=34485 RepID=A0ACC2SCE8_9FUNG|nr:hypothetical protein DSO57_1037807 [Entomophthora muscae]